MFDLHIHKGHGTKTWQGADSGWGAATQKVTWHFSCVATWKIKNVIFPQPQDRQDVKGKLVLTKNKHENAD